jgi:hypothetical protein
MRSTMAPHSTTCRTLQSRLRPCANSHARGQAPRQHSQARARLRIEAELLSADEQRAVRFTIADNAAALAAQPLAQLFHKSYSTKPRRTNSGLGLHWCANALDALGARITAPSDGLGQGGPLRDSDTPVRQPGAGTPNRGLTWRAQSTGRASSPAAAPPMPARPCGHAHSSAVAATTPGRPGSAPARPGRIEPPDPSMPPATEAGRRARQHPIRAGRGTGVARARQDSSPRQWQRTPVDGYNPAARPHNDNSENINVAIQDFIDVCSVCCFGQCVCPNHH